MYKNAMTYLVLGNLLFVMGFVCVKELAAINLASEPVAMLRLELAELEEKAAEREQQLASQTARNGQEGTSRGLGIADTAVSGQRVVDYQIMEQHLKYDLEDSELDVLLRIVEAEAGCEDEDGRLLVANVVLNRMNSDLFPDTIREVVYQEEQGVYQFSPVGNGSINRVRVSEETVSAVGRALMGEDISEGALYFVARQYTDSSKLQWFDNHLTYLFQYGGHEFFKQ